MCHTTLHRVAHDLSLGIANAALQFSVPAKILDTLNLVCHTNFLRVAHDLALGIANVAL